MHGRGVERVARRGFPVGPGLGSGAGPARTPAPPRAAPPGSAPTSATIASPIGARAASSGSLVIATSLRALGQQRAGDVRVVGEDRAADDEDQVVALEGLPDRADRRRQHAAEVRVVLGEAEAAAARSPASPRPAGAGARRGAIAASQPPQASMSGPATRTGLVAASRRSARRADRVGVGDGAAADLARDRLARVGLVDLGVPVVHRQRDEDRALAAAAPARWAPWASASGTSSARAGS